MSEDFSLKEGEKIGDEQYFLYKEHWIKILRVYGNNFNLVKKNGELTDNFNEINCVVCGKNVNQLVCYVSNY